MSSSDRAPSSAAPASRVPASAWFAWAFAAAGLGLSASLPSAAFAGALLAAAGSALAGLALLHPWRARAAAEPAPREADEGLVPAADALASAHAALAEATVQAEQYAMDAAEAQRHFGLALQGSHDGVWEYDLRTRRTYLSPGFRERLGIEPGASHDALVWFEHHVHADDVERWREAVKAQVENRASYNLDLRLCTPAGDYRWFRARGSAEWDVAGRLIRMSGSLTDITERRFAEARLRESEESFRSLSAASPVGILKSDALGQCDYCNERWQAITGLSDFEALGEGWLDAIAEEDRPAVRARWIEYVASGRTFDAQFRVVAPDGTQRWVLSRANAVHDDSGDAAGFVVTFEDVTGERQVRVALADARDKAMQAAQAKSEFLANMSHEIRTPLNGVVGMAQLLSGTELSDEQLDYVRTINTSAESLLSIINDILDFSKIEAGKLDIERVDFDLRALFEDVAELLAPRARERGLELVLAVEPSLPRRLLGDPTRIRQILLNLAANAIKFTETGEVELGAEPVVAAGWAHVVKLRVRDTGIGIASDRLGAVFESFTQADGSTTRKYGGTGLGLSISRQLARLMGGSIHLRSEVGQGSEFWIELPLAPVPDAAVQAASCDLAGAHVLLLERHPVTRRILVETLRSWGAKPEEAADVQAVLGRVSDPSAAFVDLVLLAHHPGESDGIEIARKLQRVEGHDRRAVIVLASNLPGEGTDEQVGPGRAIESWLVRPMREASLARVLGRALGRVGQQARVVSLAAAREDFTELSLLLVDDNEVNRKVALRMLEKLGVRAASAVNGAEAVIRITEHAFDLVFMDCQMPEMDGFEATRAVREREAAHGGHVRIVAMTANAMAGDRERCIECGMDDYLAKPVKLDGLVEQLRKAMELRAGPARRAA